MSVSLQCQGIISNQGAMRMVLLSQTIPKRRKTALRAFLYFQSIDTAIATIEDCFKQADYNMYAKVEQVIRLAAKKDDNSSELQSVLEFHRENFNRHELEPLLQIFKEMEIACAGHPLTIRDIHSHMKSFSSPQKALISQIVRLLKFVLLMPATNDVFERSASAIH